ncbi:alpha-amylase [Vibrio sp. UCD-FRSSP16_10]|uniref:alpha-amylase n=1 Tax=unclassified Vibrio TaxID=2614977 RepID=UPI000801F09C|nr:MULTISPECIES: alpha-amylase [unclassified Vibrio]OBT16297.1 alpha-amylase [Vibrio sp. UCD-FRSSP16_30]OBT21162.1 alpha-amylase [Vibrio sp. UCD-FRSSP16_10]
MKKSLTYCAILSAITLTSPLLYAEPNISIATSTTARDFPLNANEPLIVTLNKNKYVFKVAGLEGNCTAPESQRVRFNTPLGLNCQSDTELPFNIRFSGDYAISYDEQAQTLSVKRQPTTSKTQQFVRPLPKVGCETYTDMPAVIKVADTFADGTQLKEAFSGQTATVSNGTVTFNPTRSTGGVMLIEKVAANKKIDQPLDWRNANIYFVMVDRFNNGDNSNDHSYGRKSDGQQEIGTFHGGDLKGVIEKLDYIQSLGTDAIWLSPIVEQVHGFVGGGDKGSFPFYAYHGYWSRDFTKIDHNFGDDNDLKTLVEEAHKRGIKVMLDAVINHPGYATLADIQFDDIAVLTPEAKGKDLTQWKPKPGNNWHSSHELIDYKSPNWSTWWGADWVRSGLPGYDKPGSGAKTLTLAGLPDFKTESDKFVTPPQWLLDNPGTHVIAQKDYRVADYLVEWQTDWVKRFGIDAFRVDTVKHVEGEVWLDLKAQASKKLAQWQKDNDRPQEPFWMMGEVWAHSAYRSPYADEGFDALINFDMQKQLDRGAVCLSDMRNTYTNYAKEIQENPGYTPVSYMSSHDTELFFARFKSFEMQRNAANALLLSPGAIQIYYGDEVARDIGPYADDFHQGTRSDMPWALNEQREALLNHWQTLGQFRQRHPAIGGGIHTDLTQARGYAFSRTLNDDSVIVYYSGK